MGIKYRLVQKDDLPGVQRLWKEETNWGTLAEELWQRLVVDAPEWGGISGAVATDDSGAIVGQFAFVPSLVWIDGREVRAFRPGAPIVSRSLRFRGVNPLNHPAVAMYNYAVKALRARGDGLIYMVPDPRWLRLFKMFPFLHCGSFPLWQLPLPLDRPLKPGDGYSAARLDALAGERIDRLWERARRLHGCQVVRDSRTLPWKLSEPGYEVVGVERGGELVGLASARRRGDRQWLLCDVVTVDAGDALRETVLAAVNLGHERALEAAGTQKTIRKIAVLATPPMEPALRTLGFQRDAYDFPLIVHVLDPSLTKHDISPTRWYVSAND
ncbi:MAG TPA: hypothetical protein VFR81_11310 [Longimicrobium sp.]|nr:hypothetical protein [Longimicrobium sp.]